MKKYLLMALMAGILLGLTAQSPEAGFNAADQSVMLLPTAYTMPAGTHALTSFEILLLQYSYSVTDRLHASAGMVFPITTDMIETFSFGGKFRYLDLGKLQASAWASLTPKSSLLTAGSVFSYGNPNSSLHLAAALVGNLDDNDQRVLFGLGGIQRLSDRVQLLGEVIFLPQTEWLEEDNEETVTGYDPIALLGFRFKGQKISWDLGGARTLSEDMGDVIAIPFLKATFLF